MAVLVYAVLIKTIGNEQVCLLWELTLIALDNSGDKKSSSTCKNMLGNLFLEGVFGSEKSLLVETSLSLRFYLAAEV